MLSSQQGHSGHCLDSHGGWTSLDVEGIHAIQDKGHLFDSSSLLSFTNTQLQRSPHGHPFLLVMDGHGPGAQNQLNKDPDLP